ncbi:MAG: family 20 glycosylhydrolase [Bacteroidales bacterium]
MKKLLKIIRNIILILVGLVLVISILLIAYYHANYTETPEAVGVTPKPSLKSQLVNVDTLGILPLPQKVILRLGTFKIHENISYSAPEEDIQAIASALGIQFQKNSISKSPSDFMFVKIEKLQSQAYSLEINPNQVKIEYSDLPGMFYALTTLKQLAIKYRNHLPCLDIEDAPDMKIRGAMLDISRNKIPKIETLLSMIDFLACLKYNHLQLYIEGFSFAYPSFKNLWEKTDTPLTPDEIKQLDTYCKDRYIELVPNQNSLGHMAQWLAKDEFKDLAECPKGYKLLGLIEMKTTLNPDNPKSLELVKKMSDDLLPNFTSENFNVNLDEPFELGKSKTRPIKDEKEIAKLYLSYAKKLNEYVNARGKKMMMWGDVVSRNPDLIPEIPENITLLEWGYEDDHPFKTNCGYYSAAKRKFLVCPGTSSWSSYTGRTDNMMGNIENAVENGMANNAGGILVTDWGDNGHWQYLTVSYAGLAYASALSWNSKSKGKFDLGGFLSTYAFRDKNGIMGDIALELGRYNQFEEYPMMAMTTTSMPYMLGFMDKAILNAVNEKMQEGFMELLSGDTAYKEKIMAKFSHPAFYNAPAILNYVDSLGNLLSKAKLQRSDSMLVIDEYRNAIRMIKLGAKIKQYNLYHLQQAKAENLEHLNEMKLLCEQTIAEHKRLWLERNKTGRLDLSLQNLEKIQKQIDAELKKQEKNIVLGWFARQGEKIVSAVAVLYLK